MTQSCKESVPLKTQRNLKCYGTASCSSMTSNKTCPTQDILTKSATPGQEMLANAADITETYTKLYRNRKVSWSGYRQWEDNRSLLYLLSASWAVKSISLQSPGLPLLSKARIPVTTPWPAHTNCQKSLTKPAWVWSCFLYHNSITSTAAPACTTGKQSWEEQDGTRKEMATTCPTLMLFLRTLSKIWDYDMIHQASPHPACHHIQPTTTTTDPEQC